MSPVVLHGVFARDEAGPKRSARGGLNGVTLALDAGVTAVLGTPADGALALYEVLSGVRRPKHGSVRVAGLDPARSAPTRARIGSSGLTAALPPARTVVDAVAIAASAWTRAVSPAEVLATHQLDKLARRPLASITPAEARAVERAIALSVPDPALIVLHEPYFDDVDGGALADRLDRLGAHAPVVLITSSLRDAGTASDAWVLTQGSMVHRGPASELGPLGAAELVIDVTSGGRPLAARLLGLGEVHAVGFEARGDSLDGPATVRVSGADARDLARSVADATREVGAIIAAISESTAQLSDIRALSAWRGRIADAAARQAAALRAQIGTWRPVGPVPAPHPAAPLAPPPDGGAGEVPAPASLAAPAPIDGVEPAASAAPPAVDGVEAAASAAPPAVDGVEAAASAAPPPVEGAEPDAGEPARTPRDSEPPK